MIGQNISHYKILEKLGEGGMGVVYKAQDTKLDRLVALKFLPQHLSASEQDKVRFIQEAKSAASLNHPNICTIYGVEEYEGQIFIEMEFVEGQTLREKGLNVPLKQSIEIGIQIADGLAVAHEKGIVHRDIKPENIMLQRDGRVRIMDFGLAKLKGASRLTKSGSTVGTTGYMSPEQVQGLETDHRTDIFSLGVILYELFAGQSPFKGVHETAINYEIVNVDPQPMSLIKPELAPELDSIVLECLMKDLSERTQSVAEVAKDLRHYKRESSKTRVSRISSAQPAMSRGSSLPAGQGTPEQIGRGQSFLPAEKEGLFSGNRLPWILVSVLFVGLATLGMLYFRNSPNEGSAIRATIPPPEQANFYFFGNFSGPPAISLDGKRLAFVARDSAGKQLVYVRSLDALTAQPLAGTQDALHPFWSPDSRFIGFFAQGKLKRIDAGGGPPILICDAPNSRGGTWGSEGMIVLAATVTGPLSVVSASGGTPAQITRLDSSRREQTHRWPFFLPDGKHFLYFARTVATGSQGEGDGIYLASLDQKVNKILVNASSNAVYVSGYLLFVRGSSLMAQRFSLRSLDLEEEATTIVQGIAYDPSIHRGLFTASENGLLVYQTGNVHIGSMLSVVDRSGKALGVVGDIAEYNSLPRISPDGKDIAATIFDQKSRNNDLWIQEISRNRKTRFTFDLAGELSPCWSPDGTRIVFQSNRKARFDLYAKSVGGSGSEELLFESAQDKLPTDWSRDGKLIAFNVASRSNTHSDIWILPLNPGVASKERKPVPFLQTEFDEGQARFSPDGHWLAYASNESGQLEVYLRGYPGPGGRWQVSTSGGGTPSWRHDGKEIYYISNENKLMAAEIGVKGATVEVNNVHSLFDLKGFGYDVMPGGNRFIIDVPVETQLSSPLTLVVNWTEELKKK